MFELLFKYPASLFHKGHFVLLTPWPLWLLGAGVLAAAGLLYWHVRRHHGMLSGMRPIAIWLLETSLIALLLFLLWHPALSVATLRPQQNVVAVLVDNSRSMSINDESGTREARAEALLNAGLLKSLGDRFQVRVYRFGSDAERIPMQKPLGVAGNEPATRIGNSLEHVLAESSSLPLGAMVLLSDGADNSGGIDRDTIEAIRRQRIPIHTIGLGREHPQRDIEIADAVLPARALPQSRLTAAVTLQSYGLSGTTAHLNVRDAGKVLASQDIKLKGDGVLQTESITFNAGAADQKTLAIGVDPVSGEENVLNNRINRLVSVQARKPRILYFDGEPQWEYKFVRRAMDDNPDIVVFSMVRTTQNKILTQPCPDGGCPDGFKKDSKELADGFPSKPEDLFAFQGLMLANVEAGYFTPTQEQMIHDFVDRRGGGLLFMGGRASLSDGNYATSSLADLVPTKLPPNKGTFHRDFSKVDLTPAGRDSVMTRLDDNPERNAQRWKDIPMVADYQEIGPPKPGATVLLNVIPSGRSAIPLLVTEPYGRGRTAVFATGGSWRWKMWMPHDDKTHATFWQQMFRYLVTDTPSQVTATTPKTVFADDRHVPIRVEVRDKEYKPLSTARVQARFLEPDGSSATIELTPQPLEEGVYTGDWTAEKPGTYVAEILAGQEQQEVGRDVIAFRREDGVAENFHTGQNRELLQKLSEETGGKYYTASNASKLASEISYSEAGITSRETRDLWDMPIIFLLALGIRASEWTLRRKWGVV